MNLIPKLAVIYKEREQLGDNSFSVSFMVSHDNMGFRALGIVTFACGEINYAQKGHLEVKAYSVDEESRLWFDLCGKANPDDVWKYMRCLLGVLHGIWLNDDGEVRLRDRR